LQHLGKKMGKKMGKSSKNILTETGNCIKSLCVPSKGGR